MEEKKRELEDMVEDDEFVNKEKSTSPKNVGGAKSPAKDGDAAAAVAATARTTKERYGSWALQQEYRSH